MHFEAHLRVGVVGHAIGTVLLGIASMLGLPTVVLLGSAGVSLPVTLVGASVPDFDEPHSKPYRYFRPAAAVAVASGVFLALHVNHHLVVSLTHSLVPTSSGAFLAGEIAIGAPLFAGVATYELTPALLRQTKHRAIFHQIPTGLVASTIIYSGAVTVLAAASAPRPLLVAGVVAFFFFIGFCSHLYADGLLQQRRIYIGRSLDDALSSDSE